MSRIAPGPLSEAQAARRGCRRVSPLDRFLAHKDVADPLYGDSGGAGEAGALREALAHLAHACSGLLNYLTLLQHR